MPVGLMRPLGPGLSCQHRESPRSARTSCRRRDRRSVGSRRCSNWMPDLIQVRRSRPHAPLETCTGRLGPACTRTCRLRIGAWASFGTGDGRFIQVIALSSRLIDRRWRGVVSHTFGEVLLQSRPIAPGIQTNFLLLSRVFRGGRASLVMCRHPDGRTYPIICALNSDPRPSACHGWSYSPFGILLSDATRPLIAELEPPSTLYGKWNRIDPAR